MHRASSQTYLWPLRAKRWLSTAKIRGSRRQVRAVLREVDQSISPENGAAGNWQHKKPTEKALEGAQLREDRRGGRSKRDQPSLGIRMRKYLGFPL